MVDVVTVGTEVVIVTLLVGTSSTNFASFGDGVATSDSDPGGEAQIPNVEEGESNCNVFFFFFAFTFGVVGVVVGVSVAALAFRFRFVVGFFSPVFATVDFSPIVATGVFSPDAMVDLFPVATPEFLFTLTIFLSSTTTSFVALGFATGLDFFA